MVCCPCFLIPILIWVFQKFIGPWLSKIWSKPEEMVKNVENNLVCPMPKRKKPVDKSMEDVSATAVGTEEDNDLSKANGCLSSGTSDCNSCQGQRLKAE
ncbi:UPF0729 protein C18orf32 homolog [Aplysia californica]|uniref:UPF0729 protein C18orf32 homolog n=1 Tax=Aplysia californica TaxID=6500 RepID=A0ABM0K334_APLCA|nr:UPF0729 protein C18orf32 homolog [Aplysia californica]